MDELKKQARTEQKKKEIINGAIKAFCRSSVDSTTVDDICKEVGCSHGLFYHYFKDIDDLLETLKKTQNSIAVTNALNILRESKNAVVKLKNLIDLFCKTVEEDNYFGYKFFYFLSDFIKLQNKGALENYSSIKTFDLELINEIKNLFKELVENKYIKDDYSAEEYFRLALMGLIGEVAYFVLVDPVDRVYKSRMKIDLLLSSFIKREALINAEKE